MKIILEIFFSIHALLLFSSFIIGGNWLLNQPTLKLKLLRVLFISCVLSPIVVHCFHHLTKPTLLKLTAVDSLQTYANQAVLPSPPSNLNTSTQTIKKIYQLNYWQLLAIVFCLIVLYRVTQLLINFKKLNLLLNSAIPLRRAGKLIIKVSDRIHIPFSVCDITHSYIVLPLSLMSSTRDMKIAIAHEGQHHRSGDCVWAYFIEFIRVIFVGNLGVARWQKILSLLQELSCDEALVGHLIFSAHDYGDCLLKVVQTVANYSKSSHREIACTVGMALGNTQCETKFIIRRISMLPIYQLNTVRRSLLSTIFASFTIIAPLCGAYAAMGSLTDNNNLEINLTKLNPKIQQIATAEISAAVKKYHAKSGAVMVADPATGNVIAFAEAGNTNGANDWKTRIFAPASTIKPFIAAAAIDSGISSATKMYDCHSPYIVANEKFMNNNPNDGTVSLADAVAKSVNVCLIKVAEEVGADTLQQKMRAFGFDMNNLEHAGKNTDLQIAKASLGENIPVSLQSLTNAYVILANKGHASSANNAVISAATANSVTDMLVNAVNNGTGKEAAIANVAVAAKTGTMVDETDNSNLALFSGYVPAEASKLVMVVVIEDGHTTTNGKSSVYGGALAAPVFHNVALKSLNVLN